jgi:CheY-like chemotaxis protein
VPTFLLGDSVRIRQVLNNLVGNAIKFTRHGEVAVFVKTVSKNVGGVCLQFSIRDTGIGVPEEKLDLIFAPFEQADRSTTRKYGGTGLGLTICSRLVQLMGGKIWAESKLGYGSTFHFTACFDAHLAPLPQSASPRLDHGNAPPKSTLQILVAEDNPVNQRLAVALLEQMGHHASVAENGHKVLQALEKGVFDVVLMDVQMPEMDGLETTVAIREREKRSGAHIPIIAMTAQAMLTDREQCLSAGMDGYISKPISRAELAKVLEAVLAGSSRK